MISETKKQEHMGRDTRGGDGREGEKLKKIREMGGGGVGQTTIVVFCDEQQEEETVSSDVSLCVLLGG